MDDFFIKFLHFEDHNSLFEKDIEDFHYWIYIRFNVYMKLEEIRSNQIHILNKKKVISIFEVVAILKNCILSNPLLYKKKKKILFVCHARRALIEGKYRCLYTDKIAETFKEDSISCEFIYGTKHFEPAYTENLLKLDSIDIFPFLLLTLKKMKNKDIVVKIEILSIKLNNMIEKTFGINIGHEYLSKLITKRFFLYKMKKKYLYRLIDNIEPKVIVEVVSYEMNKLIINEIATEKGICTIELQHGVIGNGHIAYNYLRKNNYSFLPNKIFLFSSYWKSICNLPIDDKDKIVTGFPYAEEQFKKYPPIINTKKYIRILVLSQPEFSVKLIEMTEKFLEIISNRDINVSITYKLHPSEYDMSSEFWNSIIRFPQVSLIKSSEIPLYLLFAESDIQIGVTSTAIYEGLLYDLRTFIYHIEKTDVYMGNICKNGYATFFDTPKELVNFIESFRYETKKEKQMNAFFVKESENNMINEIRKILGENHE